MSFGIDFTLNSDFFFRLEESSQDEERIFFDAQTCVIATYQFYSWSLHRLEYSSNVCGLG